MHFGFKYKGRHTSEFGALMRSKSRPILPQKRQRYLDLPNKDGSINYANVNDYGRAMYDNRTITVTLLVRADNVTQLENRVSRVAEWLIGSGTLVFDDMPDTAWMAAVDNAVDFAPEREGRKALITVDFVCQPFSHALFSVGAGVYLGLPIALGTQIELGATDNDFRLTGTSGSVTVNNVGTAWARPAVTVTRTDGGAVGTWSMSGARADGSTATLTVTKFDGIPNVGWTVDLDKYTLKRLSADHFPDTYGGALLGEFFELAPGENTIYFTFSESAEHRVKFVYEPQYIYSSGGGE